jgi:hypothetical protein
MLQIDSQSIGIAVKSKSKNVRDGLVDASTSAQQSQVDREFQINGHYDLIVRQRMRRFHLGLRRSSTGLIFLGSQKGMDGT